jgi:3-methyladenine DNA glycosylase AlkD
MEKLISDLREELRQNIDEHTRNTAQRFFREKVVVYGIKTAVVTKISKKYFKEIKNLDKSEIFKLCEVLFSSWIMEESFIACKWSFFIQDQYEEKDFCVFENWLKIYITNWATCDTFCNHTIGAFIEMYPSYADKMKQWTKSDNRWVRRGSAVSLIVPAKKGEFLKEALEIADLLITDEDDLVQKGYGWLLKEESRVHQKEIFEYVLKNRKIMPRTALRYAIEKMSRDLRVKAMEK